MPSKLAVIAFALAACKHESAGPPGRPWDEVLKEVGPKMTALRTKLVAAKAALDAAGDPKALARCAPSQSFTYAEHAPHDLDLLDYAAFPTDGPTPARAFNYEELVPRTALRSALEWTNPANKFSTERAGSDVFRQAEADPESVQVLASVESLKSIVVVKDLPGSVATDIKALAFVVGLEPPHSVCLLADLGQTGAWSGSAGKEMVETTYRRDTGAVVRTREYLEGGYHHEEATTWAQNNFAKALWTTLKLTLWSCVPDVGHPSVPACPAETFTRCIDNICRYDPALESAVTKERETAFKVFEATRATRDECQATAKTEALTTKDGHVAKDGPFMVCAKKLDQQRDAEGAKLGITREQFSKYETPWAVATHK